MRSFQFLLSTRIQHLSCRVVLCSVFWVFLRYVEEYIIYSESLLVVLLALWRRIRIRKMTSQMRASTKFLFWYNTNVMIFVLCCLANKNTQYCQIKSVERFFSFWFASTTDKRTCGNRCEGNNSIIALGEDPSCKRLSLLCLHFLLVLLNFVIGFSHRLCLPNLELENPVLISFFFTFFRKFVQFSHSDSYRKLLYDRSPPSIRSVFGICEVLD